MSEVEVCNLRPAIPEDWEIKPLASVSIGGAHNGYFKKPELVGDGYKLINVSELYQSFGIDTDHAKVERVRASIVDYSRYGVHDGDIFFTRSSLVLSGIAACNVLRKVKEPTLFECHVMRIVPDRKQVDSDFVAYCCRDSFSRSYLMSRAKQTTMTTISQPEIEQLPIPVPPLPQQRKIARILTTLDNVITQTEALIAKYQAIKQGLMHDLFTRGVDATGKLRPPQPEAPELYKQSELGWIPKQWDAAPLSHVSEVGRGKFTPRPRNDPKYYGGEHPFIQTGNIAASIGRYLSDHTQTLNDLGTTVSKRFPEGTIVVTIAANIADTAILAIPMYLPDSIVGVVVHQNVVVRFMELCLRRAKHVLDAKAPQSAQKNINLTDLWKLSVPLPSTEEQQRISNIYEVSDRVINVEEQRLEKLLTLKIGLMQDLLTGKVPVKADEPEEITHA